jgi:tetratricopeptide (TPR) repeat protein
LLYAPTDRHLWADTYESDLQDVLVLQGEVARAIAEQVRIKLTPDDQVRLTTTRPVNPEALEAYLKGNYGLRRSAGRPGTGIEYFRRAIAADPSYSQAYVGLSLAYVQMSVGHGPSPPRVAFKQMKEAASEALRLDPALGEAHACLAWVRAFAEWDWPAAEGEFRRAVELSPNSPEAHRMYSWYLSAMDRPDEAIAQSTRGRELAPASLTEGYAVAAAYWWARQYERAAAESVKLEQMDPTFAGAHRILGVVCLQKGAYGQAVWHFQREIDLSGEAPHIWGLAYLASAYAQSGKRAEALNLLLQLQSASSRKYVSPYLFAILQTSLGNKTQAVQWLEKAYAERNFMLAFLRADTSLDSLRSDPRFQDLLRRMNFPPQKQ